MYIFNRRNTVNGAWSTYGSRVVDAATSHTICEYNHTTNFAILMSPRKTVCLLLLYNISQFLIKISHDISHLPKNLMLVI